MTEEPTPTPLRAVPDLKGLVVDDASGVRVGQLFGSLADQSTGLLRYLDIDLDTAARHVLVPIGHARLYEDREPPEIRLRAALAEELEEIPPWEPGASMDDPYETLLLQAHGQFFHGERYYAHPAFDHRGLYRGEQPIEREPANNGLRGLQPLEALPDYRVRRGEPDIRGWPVRGDAGTIGVVKDLIVDTDEERVRYVVVDGGRGECTLLPIGFLTLNGDEPAVLAPGVREDDLGELPAYDGGPVDRRLERAVRDALAALFAGVRRYTLPDFRTMTRP